MWRSANLILNDTGPWDRTKTFKTQSFIAKQSLLRIFLTDIILG